MISSNNIKSILTNLFNKSKAETDAQYNDLSTNMNKGWISSGTIDDIRGNDTTNDTPVGTIISVMGTKAPLHYLVCDGSEYNISDYPELVDYFKDQFGSANKFGGDGINTFKVPDLRGEFLRGTGTNSHTNSGNGADVGVHQAATVIPRTAVWGANANYGFLQAFRESKTTNVVQGTQREADTIIKSTTSTYGNIQTMTYATDYTNQSTHYTSRPTNTSVLYCIKYESTKLLSISMYDGTHYSEEEQVIGQWIDGKPLYRKCFNVKMPPINKEISYDVSLLNIDWPVNSEGFCKGTATGKYYNINGLWGDIEVSSDKKNLIIYTTGSDMQNGVCIISLEYTKTTDTPFSVSEDIAWVALDSEVDDIINKLGE